MNQIVELSDKIEKHKSASGRSCELSQTEWRKILSQETEL